MPAGPPSHATANRSSPAVDQVSDLENCPK